MVSLSPAIALQRIALVEQSYLALGNAILASKLTAGHPFRVYVSKMGGDIHAWKVGATALAHKSPPDAISQATEQLGLVHRAGERFEALTGTPNPTVDPELVDPSSNWLRNLVTGVVVVAGLALLVVVGLKVWRS